MKIRKVLAIIQLSLMYVSLICLYLGSLVFNNQKTLTSILIIGGLVMAVLAGLFALAICAISFVSIFANKAYDCTKFVMIYKIVAIPWFIGNFIMGILLIAGMLNPFLLLAIPIVIMLLILSTYICMVSSSTINFSHIVVLAKNNGLSLNVPFMIGIIISFIFCLDVVGAILIFLENSTNA